MKRLWVAVLGGAALAGATAAPASANDAWLWACHGPNGEGLQTTPLTDAAGAGLAPFSFGAPGASASVVGSGDRCAPGGAGGGLTGSLVAGAGGQSAAQVTVYVPSYLSLLGVRLVRATHGFAAAQPGSGLSYDARTTAGILTDGTHSEQTSPGAGDLAGDVTYPVAGAPTGDHVQVEARCDATPSVQCAGGPVSFDLSAVALHVDDPSKPAFAVGGPGRAANTVEFDVAATDRGTGLALAQALLDGTLVASKGFGGDCADLSPASPRADVSLLATCPSVAPAQLSFDTRPFADGVHTLVIKVFDAAGNETDQTRTLEVANHVDLGSATQTLTIGTSVAGPQSGPTGSAIGGIGGVAGATATSCIKPKLSVALNQKPLRVRHGVAVLKKHRRYRFRGRLTCLVGGRRVSAPKRTRVLRLEKVGKRTVDKGGVLVRGLGRVTFIVPALSSRTLIFRFINSDGHRTDVRIKIRVARR